MLKTYSFQFQCQQNLQPIRLRGLSQLARALSQEKQHSGNQRLSVLTGEHSQSLRHAIYFNRRFPVVTLRQGNVNVLKPCELKISIISPQHALLRSQTILFYGLSELFFRNFHSYFRRGLRTTSCSRRVLWVKRILIMQYWEVPADDFLFSTA